MKTFSKVIAFIGMIAMLFSLVGCGKKGGDDTPKVPTKLIAKYSDGTVVTSLNLEVGESKTIEFSTDLKDHKLTKSYLKNAGEPEYVSCDKNNLSFTITGLKATGEQPENLVFTYKVSTKTLTLTIPVTVYEYEPTELIASSTEETLRIGEEKVIALTTNPENRPLPEDAVVGWTSSNLEIASVADDGTVTGVAAGEATITATYKDLTATVNVTVKDSVAESLEAVIEPTSVKEGEKANITLKVKYDDADAPQELKPNANVSFEADKDVVLIDENGVVTAKEVDVETTVNITVTYTYKEGATPVSDDVELKIVPIVVDSLIAEIDQESLKEGETANISLKVKYGDGTESDITSDEVEIVADEEDAVTIENGVITAKEVAEETTVNITVTYTYKETDYTDEVSVTVLPYVATALIASAENEVLQLSGEDVVTTTITLTTEPDSKPLAASEAEFSVEENAAVTVSPDGVVTAVKPGTATVTVTYGELTSEIVFTVNKDPNAPAEYAITVQDIEGAGGRFIISWTDDVYAISTGDASIVKDFTFGVEPKNGNDPAIAEGEKAVKIYMHTHGAAWANAGEKDFYLKITAKSGVTYIITGTLVVNDDKTGYVKNISVEQDVLHPAIKLSSNLVLADGEAVELPLAVTDIPTFTAANLTVTSSAEEVATVAVVEGKILVTGLTAGTTTITATYTDVENEVNVSDELELEVKGELTNLITTVEADKVNSNSLEGDFTNGWTVTYGETGGQWAAQVKFKTDADLVAGDKYYFSVTLCSESVANNVTVKFDDTVEIVYDTKTQLEAGVEKQVVFTGTVPEGRSKEDILIVLDFGGNPASTVTIKNLILTKM